jgi:hypothetical protein
MLAHIYQFAGAAALVTGGGVKRQKITQLLKRIFVSRVLPRSLR